MGLCGRADSRWLAAGSLRFEEVYAGSIIFWSLFTLLQGLVGGLPVAWGGDHPVHAEILVGLAEAPSFPGNARIVAAWFPTAERGTASAIFNSAQYFATALFARSSWAASSSHFGLGARLRHHGRLGILFSGVWLKYIHNPKEHPRINAAELAHIRDTAVWWTWTTAPASRVAAPSGTTSPSC